MNCPKCRESALRRPASSAWSPEPLQCPTCAGYWFDPKVLRSVGPEWAEPSSEDSDLPLSGDGQAGLCPHGHGLLRRAPAADLGFYLERCTSCHGIWFDAGEWTRLAEHRLQEALPLLWSESWQRDHRSKLSARARRDWAEEAFGSQLFEKLNELAELLAGHPKRSEALAFLRVISSTWPSSDAEADGGQPADVR